MAFYRFMDLPSEVRLMIYGHVARTIYQYRIPIDDRGDTNAAIILILRTVELGFLVLCRTIHREANCLIQRIIQEFISEKMPQLGGTQHENIFIGLEIIMGAADWEAHRISSRRRFFELGYIPEVYWDGRRDTPMMTELQNIGGQMHSWKRPAFARFMGRFELNMPVIVRWVKQAGQQLHYHHRLQLRAATFPSSIWDSGRFRYITVFSCRACQILEQDQQARRNSHLESFPTYRALAVFRNIARIYLQRVLRRTSAVEIQGHVYDPTGGESLEELVYEQWELPSPSSHDIWFSGRARAMATTMTLEQWQLDWKPTRIINCVNGRTS